MKKNLRFIDLYAGIGGIRLGFENENCQCVFSSEIDKYAQQTYYSNFKETPSGDITKIAIYKIPKFDILLAGFPCQSFSKAGLQNGFADIRGTAFFDIIEIVKYHKPEVIFLENVKNLVSHDNGKTFEIILNSLKQLNYITYYKTLNAKDFGLPQNRNRIYIVAFKNKINFHFPIGNKIKTKVFDILEDTVSEKYTISDKLWRGHQERKKRNKQNGKGFGYSLCDNTTEYTSTLSARYYKDGSEILIKQNNQNPRKITPREAARLQGFPDSFIISVSDAQAYKQFGNSVAIPVIKEIANKIFNSLNNININVEDYIQWF